MHLTPPRFKFLAVCSALASLIFLSNGIAEAVETIPLDVSNDVSVAMSGLRFNRIAGTYDALFSVTNISPTKLTGPLALAIGTQPESVTVSNASGSLVNGLRYIHLTANDLNPGATIPNILVKFTNTNSVKFTMSKGVVRFVPAPSITSDLTLLGGTITLPGYASVLIPPNAFVTNVTTTLSASSNPQTAEDFSHSASLFAIASRGLYEIRVNTGTAAPLVPVQIVLPIPSGLLTSQPPGSRLQLFAQILEDGGQDLLDNFEPLITTVDSNSGAVSIWLPTGAFANIRNVTQTYEAVIILTVLPPQGRLSWEGPKTFPVSLSLSKPRLGSKFGLLHRVQNANVNVCGNVAWSPPLANLNVTSSFNGVDHWGTDYSANGDAVHPVRDGTIEKIGLQIKELPAPNPRTGLSVSGWGRYVVVKHPDGSTTLYAHLDRNSTDKLIVGRPVNTNDVIGAADSTGGVTGPHLHLEYAPNGESFTQAAKIDPDVCVRSVPPTINSFSAVPVNPAEGVGYVATVNVRCPGECTVSLSVFGTDGYVDSSTCNLNGTTSNCSLFVPGAAGGVVDVVEANVAGITQQLVQVFTF